MAAAEAQAEAGEEEGGRRKEEGGRGGKVDSRNGNDFIIDWLLDDRQPSCETSPSLRKPPTEVVAVGPAPSARPTDAIPSIELPIDYLLCRL